MNIQRLISALSSRKQSLVSLKSKLEEVIPSCPEGRLNVSPKGRSRKGFYYYTIDGTGHRRYIRKDSDSLARQLAQKEYDVKLLRSVEREIKWIDCYIYNISLPSLSGRDLSIPV